MTRPKSKLTSPWEDFYTTVGNSMIVISQLREKIYNSNSVKKYEKEIKDWCADTQKILTDSFQPHYDELIDRFKKQCEDFENISEYTKTDNEGHKLLLIKSIYDVVKFLNKWMYLLAVLDNVIGNNDTWIERRDLDTEGKINFLLEKLHTVYSDDYFPINEIFFGNGIVLKRQDEHFELGKMIIDKGWATQQPGGMGTGILRLTAKGADYIEKKSKAKSKKKEKETEYSKVNFTLDELSKKLDELLKQANLQGMGQEILFDEFQELKDHYSRLDKKNWAQLLKGKLIDLGISQVINMNTVNHIFKESPNTF